ncbi:glycosyltransferase family 9 protein [Acidicapsa dinghuensis]|uniref:Glycosyltransferase family 9 protein n=1 Tax=Acidicapsa dinghuensis TaxID=2218256 RepID=A0ABW1EMD2_9BACT|nr:glycosyltransferase family 9 protein [Acidicapsa dinghuensis]
MKALIVKFGQIGDVIMAIPAIHALHEKGFEVHWVCGKSVKPLLECYSWITPITTDDKGILFGKPVDRIRGILKLWREILFRRFDLCVTLYYDQRYRLLTLPAWAKHRISLSTQLRFTNLIAGRHHTDEYARIVLGIDDSCREQSAPPVSPDRLPPSPLPEKTALRRIVIVPGGVQHLVREQATGHLPAQTLRRWPIENFVELARNLADRNCEVVLLGGPGDEWIRPYFNDITAIDCIGTLSLPEVVSMCSASDAVVTHDTGPLHLAGLSNACLVGIFGPTDPATRVPRRPYTLGIWGGQGFACRPCYDGREFAPCTFNGCMHQVTPELVLEQIDILLSAKSRGVEILWRTITPESNLIPVTSVKQSERRN